MLAIFFSALILIVALPPEIFCQSHVYGRGFFFFANFCLLSSEIVISVRTCQRWLSLNSEDAVSGKYR